MVKIRWIEISDRAFTRISMLISVIIPCYNEEATIRLLLEALYRQTFPRSQMEIIIADGLSTDQTRQVVSSFQHDFPDLTVRWVDNPKRNIPAALNTALSASKGDIVVRLDAHSVPAEDYVERCVESLSAQLGDNVGGVWEIRPGGKGWMARSIAAAAAHPLGVGDARYRYSNEPGEVDTVPFGSFRRELFDQVGFFDETLLTNEDYEFNARLRKQGGKVYLNPAIRSIYFARSTLEGLARQYWRYGFWKWRMLKRYANTLRIRQALPPLFVLGLLGTAVLALFLSFFRWLLLGELLLYFLVLFMGSIPVALRKKDFALLFGIPLAIATMHVSWGIGFLVSVLRSSIEQTV